MVRLQLISCHQLAVHPCDRAEPKNAGCAQVCNKVGDKPKCGCNDGFVLNKDLKTCDKGKYGN